MSTTTAAAGRMRPAAVAVLLSPLLLIAPASAHPEGLTPYRYVVPPPGVVSEGPPEPGSSVQPLGADGFAGTTDNQMQLTLPLGALPPRPGERGVRVLLDQLDPATLAPLPAGLEPEGNAYRVRLSYAASGKPVERLSGATLGLTAPAPPTGVLELVDGRWLPVSSTPVVGDEVVSSVLSLRRPGTLLQVYDTRTAASAAPARAQDAVQPPNADATPRGSSGGALVPAVGAAAGALAVAAVLLRVRRRALRR